MLVDESGAPVSLVSEEVVEAIANADPWFDAGSGVIVGYSSTANCAAIVTECHNNVSNPIQSAVNDARSTSGTIHIEAGTYSEQIVITKNLTLLGNSGAIINSPVSLTQYTIGNATIYPLIYANGGSGSQITVTISGLVLDGTNYGSGTTNRDLVGIAYYNANGTITNNLVQNFTVAGSQNADGIYIRNTTGVNINRNTVRNNERGIFVRDIDTVINNNNIYSNSGPGVIENISGTDPVNAENNYWGCVPRYTGGTWRFPSGCENVSGQIDRTPPLTSAVLIQTDADGDTVFDIDDNCSDASNVWQEDNDHDGVGDACDDSDGDGVFDATDNCVAVENHDQTDTDTDSDGNACDTDDDGDGVEDGSDNCALVSNPGQEDNDVDGLGDACDADDDNDGVGDSEDNCAWVSNPAQEDNEDDGLGDACDADDDNDGVADAGDNCSLAANPGQEDNDDDGLGDVCDPDDDGDGVADVTDNCAWVSNPAQEDNEDDGLGDICDADDDNDGVDDALDGCPLSSNPLQEDTDGDGTQEACDPFPGDFDNDSAGDASDNCIAVSNPGQEDQDHDGIGNVCDPFPADAMNDQDDDGFGANEDNCPQNYNPNQLDSDEDGRGNACDRTPYGGVMPSILPSDLIIPLTGGTTSFIDPEIDLDAALAEFANNEFPLEQVGEDYQFSCILESVTVLGDPLAVADASFPAVGACTYLANGVRQTLYVGLPEGFTPGMVTLVTFCGEEPEHIALANTGNPAAVGGLMIPCAGFEVSGDLNK